MSVVLMGNDARCPCECESPCVLNDDLNMAEHKLAEALDEIERLKTELHCYRRKLREKNDEILDGNRDIYAAFSMLRQLIPIAENEGQLSEMTMRVYKELENRWFIED